MKERESDLKWFPFWIDKWLFGSMRIEHTRAEMMTWIDLLALAGKDNGYIRANEQMGYPVKSLAGILQMDTDELENHLKALVKSGKLERQKTGVLKIITYEKYQFTGRHVRRIKKEEHGPHKPEYKRFLPCPEKYKAMATKKGIVRVSRLYVAIAINRPLKAIEQVHHIDGDDDNNKIENLMLFDSQANHLRYQHGYQVDCVWRGDNLGGPEIQDIGAKIQDSIREDKIREDKRIEDNSKPSYPRIKILESDIKLTKLLLDKILENNPESRIRKMTNKQKESWQNDCRLMREQDCRAVSEIREVIIWAQNDDFWHANILSMGKLRKQWDQLILKMGKNTKKKESWAERSERKERENK